MKGSAITRIVLYSILLVLLVGILVASLSVGLVIRGLHFWPGVYFSHVANGTVSDSGAVDASQIRQIEIEWVAGNITIEPGEGDQITFTEVSAYSDSEKMVWKQTGHKLHIQFNSVKWFIGIHADYEKDLVITVPESWLGQELDISAVSTDVTVTDAHFDQIDLENVSGKYVFRNCTADKVSFNAVSGVLRFDGTLRDLNCNTVSGDCVAILTDAPRDISLDSMSGNLDVTLPEDTGYTVSIDSLSGHVSSEFMSAWGSHSYGDGRCRINMDSLSGDIFIRKG